MLHDVHSYSTPDAARVRHLNLELRVNFERRILIGTATWSLAGPAKSPLVLDTKDLQIHSVAAVDANGERMLEWKLGPADPILGAPLTIQLPPGVDRVRVRYDTAPNASALQWLQPEQTAGKKFPFLFTQSEAIHARSFIPCQDTPSVRITYAAHIHTPETLVAVMGAEADQGLLRAHNGDYRFHMVEPIPSYLIALAVGDLEFRSIGRRTGVWAEPMMVDRAAREFEDMEKMVEAAERIYGPYRWGRYDVLVLPPSFPFGGMENPRLTFATPTILAGDKSLVSLIAHELAHSWSGNLVTNATWGDFWLNEGVTVYLERRIVGEIYGGEREDMEAVLGRQELEKEMASLPAQDQLLKINLAGRNPDDGVTSVPYEKGYLFLRTIAEQVGRDRFDEFLRGYFDHFAFRSITTEEAIAYMRKAGILRPSIPVEEWLTRPGIPSSAFRPASDLLAKVDAVAAQWHGEQLAGAGKWSTQQWLRFLRMLPASLTAAQMAQLDQRYHFTRTGNDEILAQWLEMSVARHYTAANPELERFLMTVGRQKYLKPLYEALAKTPEGKQFARKVYARARPGYHPIAQTTVDRILR